MRIPARSSSDAPRRRLTTKGGSPGFAETEKEVETFVRREDAERFLAEVRCYDPELADRLGVETIELDA